jgi:hypothetical protein
MLLGFPLGFALGFFDRLAFFAANVPAPLSVVVLALSDP